MHKAIRYIGSKQKLLPFLKVNLFDLIKSKDTFFDGFSGTGIVSQFVAENYNINITGSDISEYSRILFNILNYSKEFKDSEVITLFNEFSNLQSKMPVSGVIFNELSIEGNNKFKRNFFSPNSAKTIDTFKFFLNQKLSINSISKNQAEILLYFLLTYACKTANTTSVFGAYLKSKAIDIPFDTEFIKKVLPQINKFPNKKYQFFRGSILENIENINHQSIIYLDPPYSSRRYESNYHILNYIVDLNLNPKTINPESKSALPLNIEENPFASNKKTIDIFNQMILKSKAKSKILAISYNTDGIITQNYMEDFCSKNSLKLKTHELTYKRFKSNKTSNTKQLKEILWLIT